MGLRRRACLSLGDCDRVRISAVRQVLVYPKLYSFRPRLTITFLCAAPAAPVALHQPHHYISPPHSQVKGRAASHRQQNPADPPDNRQFDPLREAETGRPLVRRIQRAHASGHGQAGSIAVFQALCPGPATESQRRDAEGRPGPLPPCGALLMPPEIPVPSSSRRCRTRSDKMPRLPTSANRP